ncbi:MAG: histidine kinase [Bacteroidota bacterium]|nr:histidine kinase [Bacteroidota bacterium]
MHKRIIRYWICQILGWGGWTLLNLSFFYFFLQDTYWKAGERKNLLFAILFIQFFWYILATHFLRFLLKKLGWIKFSINKVIGLFILSVLITGLLSYYGAKSTALLTGNSLVEYEKNESFKEAISKEKSLGLEGTSYYLPGKNLPVDSLTTASTQSIKKTTGWYRDDTGKWKYEDQRKGRFWWDIIFTFILIALWLLLYMIWHYLERNRKDELDRLNLEKTVKDLELKTIKSHINPHFIFNSLNSIRALVDENPQRARKAITELSNILRSSLQVEKLETVPLQKELDIVKDYLALEQMRFEERLKVELDIDEDTLKQPVPPMMLQTLVENAIKHGISKRINGGTIKIISRFTDHHFELIVQNTGNLEESSNEGFGFKSTRDRLKFLFNGNAYFKVEEIESTRVQSKIVMPVDY